MMFTASSPSLFENDPRWKALKSAPPRCRPAHRRPAEPGIHALIERKEMYALRGNHRSPARCSPRASTCGSGPIAYRIRASFLPGKGRTVESKLADDAVARHRPQQGRGAGDGVRLPRAADGAARPAPHALRDGQPEELDRPARRVHPADRRRDRLVRLRAAGIQRSALHRDIAAQLQHPGAPGLAPQPAAPAAAHDAPGARRSASSPTPS